MVVDSFLLPNSVLSVVNQTIQALLSVLLLFPHCSALMLCFPIQGILQIFIITLVPVVIQLVILAVILISNIFKSAVEFSIDLC